MSFADRFPPDIADYFDSRWIPKLLWELDLQVEAMSVASLEWHLDYPFWPSNPPAHIFDLKPRDVLSDCMVHPDHYSRILEADTSYPLDVGCFGNTAVILDGIHRLAKIVLIGSTELKVRYVPGDYISRVG